jgi:hypothetical protein
VVGLDPQDNFHQQNCEANCRRGGTTLQPQSIRIGADTASPGSSKIVLMAASPAPELSGALHSVPPRASRTVDQARECGAWDWVITQSLEIFANDGVPLPADVRRTVDAAVVDPRAYQKTRESWQSNIDRNPLRIWT